MTRLPSSFKDPSGFVFSRDGKVYRQINSDYRDNYELLKRSGLYQKLVDRGALVPHREVELKDTDADAYKIIEPEQIPFISYAYEWCFSQLKDAALLTLSIQKEALSAGLSLKDANNFNIQFYRGKPILIDTLSFEKYEEGKPWVAYKQFCENFLAPLALWSYTDDRLGKLLQTAMGIIPLDLAAAALPFKARFNPGLYLHIFLHARSQERRGGFSPRAARNNKFSKNSFFGLIDSLEGCINNLKWNGRKTLWSDYYDDPEGNLLSYENKAATAKKNLVSGYLDEAQTKKLWDLGANSGLFSRLAAQKGIEVIALDYDALAVEKNYLQAKREGEKNILPLLADIINPTPPIGWRNQERDSLLSRPLPDTILALALIHHLAIGHNIPFLDIAQFLAATAGSLIIEFVPKTDKQAGSLLQIRKDIFTDYTIEQFEKVFSRFFTIRSKTKIPDSERVLYLMARI